MKPATDAEVAALKRLVAKGYYGSPDLPPLIARIESDGERMREAQELLRGLAVERQDEADGYCPFCEMWFDAEIDEYQHQVYCHLVATRAYLAELEAPDA